MTSIDSLLSRLTTEHDGADVGARVPLHAPLKVDQGVGLLEGSIALQDGPFV